jgi:hypothetical protein
MSHKYVGIMAVAASFLLPSAALGGSITTVSTTSTSFSDNNAIIQQLQTQEQRDEYKAQYWSQEPVTQQDYYVQAKQDRQLIGRLSAGEPVSAEQVEQALRHVDTEY